MGGVATPGRSARLGRDVNELRVSLGGVDDGQKSSDASSSINLALIDALTHEPVMSLLCESSQYKERSAALSAVDVIIVV